MGSNLTDLYDRVDFVELACEEGESDLVTDEVVQLCDVLMNSHVAEGKVSADALDILSMLSDVRDRYKAMFARMREIAVDGLSRAKAQGLSSDAARFAAYRTLSK